MNFFTIIHWKRNGNEIQALIFWYKLSMIRSLVLAGRISKSGILRSEVSRYTQGVSTITILIKLFSEIFLVFWKPILSNLFTLINNRPHSKKCIFIFNWNFYTSRYIIYLLTFCFFFWYQISYRNYQMRKSGKKNSNFGRKPQNFVLLNIGWETELLNQQISVAD